MNIHLNEYFLKSAWGWSGLASDNCLWKTSSPNKEMQALSECVKASQDPRCRSNRPWTSQRWRPATGAGWKHPRWSSPTQTRATGSRLRAAGTSTPQQQRNPGIMRRPKSLHLTIFVNEIKTSIQKPLLFREAKKWLPFTNPGLAPSLLIKAPQKIIRWLISYICTGCFFLPLLHWYPPISVPKRKPHN